MSILILSVLSFWCLSVVKMLGLLELYSAQAVHEKVAQGYGVPVVSFRDAMLGCGRGSIEGVTGTADRESAMMENQLRNQMAAQGHRRPTDCSEWMCYSSSSRKAGKCTVLAADSCPGPPTDENGNWVSALPPFFCLRVSFH